MTARIILFSNSIALVVYLSINTPSPAGHDHNAWEFEMINRFKKDVSPFKKCPIRE